MRAVISVALCVAVIVIGAGTLWVVMSARPEAAVAAPPPPPPKNVRVEVLEGSLLPDYLVLTGGLEPWEDVTLSAEISGVIETQLIEAGDAAKAGAALFRVDTVLIEASLAQAEAQLELLAHELERLEGLRRSGIASPQELDRVRTEHRLAEVELASARTRMARSVVRAPFDGVVDTVHRRAGEWVDAGMAMARIVQIDRLKAVVGIPEREVTHFAAGDIIAVTAPAIPDRAFEGAIHKIAPTAERASRTFLTEIALDNADGALKPGMIVRASLVRREYPDAITIPIFAVRSVENERFAVVAEEGVARLRRIQVGGLHGDRVHVTEGLSAGERLIVAGHRDLRDGEPVAITEIAP